MKYFETLIEDQETTISILYQEQIIRIYSSESKVIQRLTKELGKPTRKYIKSKTYWSGASWDIDFFALDKIHSILIRDIFIDKKTKPIVKEVKKKQKKITEKNKKKIAGKKKTKDNKLTKKEVKNKINKDKEKQDKSVKKEKKANNEIDNKSNVEEKRQNKKTKVKEVTNNEIGNKSKKEEKNQNKKVTNKKDKTNIKKIKKEPISFEQIQFSF